MKIAYLILAHKSPQQLLRLVQTLDADYSSFIIHIDRKAKREIHQVVRTALGERSNIYFCEPQHVYWGDFSLVSAVLSGLEQIIKHQIDCDYVKFLSGQDYPLKTLFFIQSFLKENIGKEFIEYFKLPYKGWAEGGEKNGGLDRVSYHYFNVRGKRLRLPLKRPFLMGFEPFGGSALWCLSQSCIQYVHEFTLSNRSFMNFFRTVNLPGEVFFQTVILNSPFREHVVNNDLTYTDWVWNSPNPVVLDQQYFSTLSESDHLFARKFDMTKAPEILNLIDRHLLFHPETL